MRAPWVNQEPVENNYEDPHGGNACIKNRRSPDLTARSRTIIAVQSIGIRNLRGDMER